jgi:Flp pilus assembly protein TadD
MNDKDAVVHARCGLALGNLGKWDQAVNQFIRATDLDPRYSEGHAGLAYALANLKRLKEALAEARIAVSLAPNDPDTHSNLAWVYAKKGDYLSAAVEYRLALKIDPKNAERHKALGMALKDAEDTEGAIAELLAVTQTSKDFEAELALQSLMQNRR